MKRFLTIIAVTLLGCWSQAQQQETPSPEIMRIPPQAGRISQLKSQLDDPDFDESERHRVEAQISAVYISIGDYTNAIKHLERSISLQNNDVAVQKYSALGRLYLQVGQIDDALSLLTDAEKVHPDSIDIADLLASCFQGKKMWKESVKRFEKIEMLNEKDSNRPLPASFYFSYGVAVEQGSKDIDRAAQLFQKSLESIGPPNPRDLDAVKRTQEFKAEVLNYLGYMQVEQNLNLDVAGELLKKAAQLNPDSGAIADSLGWFYFKKERYMEAMVELLRAESYYDEEDMDGVILDHIAQTYKKIGNKENAVSYMERAVKKDPKNKEFKQRLKQFRTASE